MRLSRIIRASAIALTFILSAAVLVTITLTTPSHPVRAAGDPRQVTSRVMPPQPATPRTQFVPVRALAAAEGPAVHGERLALRHLVIATDPDDFQLRAWTTVLDQIGTPYDILFARSQALKMDSLVRPNGVGRYNAILLTSSTLLYRTSNGYVSAFDLAEWETLWDYERIFHVRQVALNASPRTDPEDYCLRPRSEGAIGADPEMAKLTRTGEQVFDYLNPAISIPISQTYVYRTSIAGDCNAQPLLELNSDVLGVLSTSPDGRERAALTFVLGAAQPATDLLGYGLLRWATRGVFLGEERHWLNVDVDDWFNVNVHGPVSKPAGTFRLSGPEARAVSQEQAGLRKRYPLAAGFTLNIAYNGSRINPSAPDQCSTRDTPDALTSYSRCLRHDFRWINHTLTHPQMNFTPYSENYREIRDNLYAAGSIGLPTSASVFKPPEYSGLGVYNPDSRSLGSPTDFGLLASNRALLKAASDLGVKYVVGDISFASHKPRCFNCGIYHPLQPDLLLVPDWPTNIAFEATTPQEQVSRYNSLYGVHGTEQRGPDANYAEFVDAEANLALSHVMSGSVYSHTVHQTNLHQYAPGRCLVFDWLDELLAKYSAYYRVPLENPDWHTLATYVQDRTAHFKAVDTRNDAVWDRVTNTVTYTPTANTALFITGLATRAATEADQRGPDSAEKYGSDSVSRLGLTGGKTVAFLASPRLWQSTHRSLARLSAWSPRHLPPPGRRLLRLDRCGSRSSARAAIPSIPAASACGATS